MMTQRSFHLKRDDAVKEKRWILVDAKDKVVGRVATEVANLLRGKNKVTYTPGVDNGDYVVLINCDKVKFTGQKWSQKIYYWHTNHIGGIKERVAQEQLAKHPEEIMRLAVRRMLPNNALSRRQITHLKIYQGETHPHEAQAPTLHEIKA